MAINKEILDAVILADLRDPSLTYNAIAVRRRVALNRICKLAVEHGLCRKRGKKPRVALSPGQNSLPVQE